MKHVQVQRLNPLVKHHGRVLNCLQLSQGKNEVELVVENRFILKLYRNVAPSQPSHIVVYQRSLLGQKWNIPTIESATRYSTSTKTLIGRVTSIATIRRIQIS